MDRSGQLRELNTSTINYRENGSVPQAPKIPLHVIYESNPAVSIWPVISHIVLGEAATPSFLDDDT